MPSGTSAALVITFAALQPLTKATIVGAWLASIALSFGDVETIVACRFVWMLYDAASERIDLSVAKTVSKSFSASG